MESKNLILFKVWNVLENEYEIVHPDAVKLYSLDELQLCELLIFPARTRYLDAINKSLDHEETQKLLVKVVRAYSLTQHILSHLLPKGLNTTTTKEERRGSSTGRAADL